MCLQMTSETALPIGYPVSPVDPSKIHPSDVFDMTCDWDRCSVIEDAASLEDALNTCKSYIRQEVPSYTEDDVQAVAQVVLDGLLDDMVDRHGIPFCRSGIKKDLKKRGIPVTKADELRHSFIDHFAPDLEELLRQYSIPEIARKISYEQELDSPYYGNYCGYPPQLVSRILRELIREGKLQA